MTAAEAIPLTRPARTSYWRADDLMSHTFPPPKWAVRGLLSEGLNIVIGAPKIGKSWFALCVAIAVALGGRALGSISCDSGPVLYLALEDTGRRLQDRLRKVLAGQAAPSHLAFATEWPTLNQGGADQLRRWLEVNPGARLVIIDTLQKIRGAAVVRGNAYAEDYTALGLLKQIADEYSVCMVVLHHDRKADAEDFVGRVSGTNGIVGAADALLAISRLRSSAEAVLEITGRDVEEAKYALRFSPEAGSWTLLDVPPEELGLTEERRRLLTVLRDQPGLGPGELAGRLGIEHNNAKQLVRRMWKDQQIDTDGHGHYFLPGGVTPVTAVTLPLDGDSSDSSDRGTGGGW